MDMEKELRRSQINLGTLGTGILLFGGWSALRALLYIWAGPAIDLELEIDDPEVIRIVVWLAIAFVVILALVGFGLRVYICRAARAESMGRTQKNTYLWLAGILLLIDSFSAVYSLYNVLTDGLTDRSRLDYTVSSLVDLSSLILLAELIVTARRVKRLRALSED
jgi:hypothetical protein